MNSTLQKTIDCENLLERCYDYLESLPCYDEELKKDLDKYYWGESGEEE